MQLNQLRNAAAITALVASLSGAASAQTTALDEIIVTAQKRTESIQDVPISVSVLDGDDLSARGIDSFEQLQFVTPGVSFVNGVNARQSSTTIRGIGTGLFNTGIEGSVAIVVDGVVLGREGAGLFDLSDVERVEVLRGPQGTLFGKNASAGVISIVTKGPSDTFEADLSATYGSFNELNLSSSIAGPIADGVSGRISAYRNTRDGFLDNLFPGAENDTLNNRDEFGFRAKLGFEISDTFDLEVGADYASRDQRSGAFTLRQASGGGAGTGLLGFGIPLIGPTSTGLGVEPGPDNDALASDQPFFADSESLGGYVEASLAVGDFDLISLSAYREWDSDDNNDADLIPLPLLTTNAGDLDQNQFSQEVRLQSPSADRFSYVVGGFYFQQDIDARTVQAGTAGLDLLGVLPAGLILGTDLNVDYAEKNYAVFGQGEYDITDSLRFIGGLRLLRSDISATQTRDVAPGAVGAFAGQTTTAAPQTATEKDTNLLWRAGLQYDVNPDVNVFGTVSRGYKSAGIVTGLTSQAVTVGGNDLPTVDPEIPTQGELGIRSVLMEGRLRANFTGFYTEIDDFQSQALLPGPGGTTLFSVTNAGKARTRGIEGDVSFQATPELSLSTAFAYTKARFADFDQAPCYALQPVGPTGCIDANGDGSGDFQDLEGQRLAQSPDFVLNALARYDFDTFGRFEPYAQIGGQYRSKATSSITNDPEVELDSRFLLDGEVGTYFNDGRAELTFLARNILGEDFVESIFNQPFDTGGYGQFKSFESERSYAVRLRFSY